MKELILSLLGLFGTLIAYFSGYKSAQNKIIAEQNEKVSKVFKDAKTKSDTIHTKYNNVRRLVRKDFASNGTHNKAKKTWNSTIYYW